MTVKDCKPGDATCAEDMDPFLSQDSENLLGRVLAGMAQLCGYILLKCKSCTVMLLPKGYDSNFPFHLLYTTVFHCKHSLQSVLYSDYTGFLERNIHYITLQVQIVTLFDELAFSLWIFFLFQIFALFWMLYVFFWVISGRLNFICRRFVTHCLFHLHTYPPMKMEQIGCSETSAYKIQTPGNYPEESMRLFLLLSNFHDCNKKKTAYII